jgi:hypothetical protein
MVDLDSSGDPPWSLKTCVDAYPSLTMMLSYVAFILGVTIRVKDIWLRTYS